MPAEGTLPEPNFQLLIRAMSDRKLAGGGTLFNAAARFPVAGLRTIELPARPPMRARRSAGLAIRRGRDLPATR